MLMSVSKRVSRAGVVVAYAMSLMALDLSCARSNPIDNYEASFDALVKLDKDIDKDFKDKAAHLSYLKQHPDEGDDEAEGPGPYFSAIEFSYTGMMLRDGATCSGTLIAPNVFLTAGHCVCEQSATTYYPDHDACLKGNAPAAHTTRVFFPGYGVFQIDGVPILSEDYHFLKINGDDVLNHNYPKETISDLAIVRLSRAVTDSLPKLAQADPRAGDKDPEFFVGYGRTAITGNPETNKIPPGEYDDFPVAEFSAPLARTIADLPDLLLQDFSGAARAGNPDAEICNGDSGGGMFMIDAGGNVSIIGVASGLLDNGAVSEKCPNKPGHAMFTSVSQHSGWIKSQIDAAKIEHNQTTAVCSDGFIPVRRNRTSRIALVADSQDIEATLFLSNDVVAPDLPLSECRRLFNELDHLITCSMKKGDAIRFDESVSEGAKGGGVHVVMCQKTGD